MRHSTDGLTLIEILVAIALTSVVALMSYYLLPAVSINKKAKSRFEASQAIQQYFERKSSDWRTVANYGRLESTTTTDIPADVPGFAWTLKACRVNLGSYACENSVTYTKTNFTASTLTAWNANTGLSGTAQAQLVRLDLTYTADSGTTNKTTTSTIELARGGM